VLPMVFTEQGVAILSSIMKSQTTIDVDMSIIRAFVLMKQMAVGYEELLKRIEELEESTDAQFSEKYQVLMHLLPEVIQRKPIGFKIPEEWMAAALLQAPFLNWEVLVLRKPSSNSAISIIQEKR